MSLKPRAGFLDEPFLRCSLCHRNEGTLSRKLVEGWAKRTYAKSLCPICVKKFASAPRPSPKPPCAACGRKTRALQNHICKRCAELGVSAPTLFDQEAK